MKELVADRQQPVFTEIEIPETQIQLIDRGEAAKIVITRLKQRGIYGQDLLFSGIEGRDIKTNGTFGDRNSTFAVTEQEFLHAAELDAKYGDGHLNNNPLAYALDDAMLPALAVYRTSFLEPHQKDGDILPRWQLREGTTMDDATVAVIYFTQD